MSKYKGKLGNVDVLNEFEEKINTDEELRLSLRFILNYFENVAIMIENGIIKMTYYKNLLKYFFIILSSFRIIHKTYSIIQ